MFRFLKNLPFFRKKPKEQPDPDSSIEEKWDADFSKPARTRFDIKAEISHDAYLRNNALCLGLRKSNCLAWIEDPMYRYGDQIVKSSITLKAQGGYGAAGFLFRMMDELTHYSVLISSKGYFRVDVLRNSVPMTLIGWTEVPPPLSPPEIPGDEYTADITVIAYGAHITLLLNDQWAAALNDGTISRGRVCFAAASYESPPVSGGYVFEAALSNFSIDSRIQEVAALYERWNDAADIDSGARIRLAETFIAMSQPAAALVQIRKSWEIPGCGTPTDPTNVGEGSPPEKSQKELLLAGRAAFQLNLLNEAEGYINEAAAMGLATPEGRAAGEEKAKLLYVLKRSDELLSCGEEASSLENSAILAALLGHVRLETGAYEPAAAAYDRAFEMDSGNGLHAKNAANAYELLAKKEEALDRYLKAGRAFLAADNYGDLGALIPKLHSLGANDWEAHALAGKWAYGIENWDMAAKEFSNAESLRKKPTGSRVPDNPPPPDPALLFLQGLLLVREGKRKKALSLMEEAAQLAPDYALFRFRLAENRFLLSGNPKDAKLKSDLEAALALDSDNGWLRNLAAQIALAQGNLDAAGEHLEKAAALLGELPDIRVNRAELYYLRGSADKALETLSTEKADDPEGMMANCGGNILVRAGRYEDADEYYRKALRASPENTKFLCNRASCLIEMGLYGEADSLAVQAYSLDPSPDVLELISYIAVKKGEYQRAEAACKDALEKNEYHQPSLFSLGWIYANAGRWDEVQTILSKLDELELEDDAVSRREELRAKYENAVTRIVSCAGCGRQWRFPREMPAVKTIRLYAMPPDEFPAGTCPECGDSYCIGCGKKSLDADGRFLCPACGKTLKLTYDGLKKIIYDWAENNAEQKS
jgi:tetratricopeptide (TPR) repeat protein